MDTTGLRRRLRFCNRGVKLHVTPATSRYTQVIVFLWCVSASGGFLLTAVGTVVLSQGCPPASARHSRPGPHAPLPLPAQERAGKEGHGSGRVRVRSQGAGLGEAAEP